MLKGPRNHDSGKGAPSAELGIAKQDMRPVVQRRLDNLQAQVARILERYGVSNFEELKVFGEDDSDKVEMDDITRLLELSAKISHVVETGEVDCETEIPIGDYKRVSGGQLIGDKIVFRAVEKNDKIIIVTEDGTVHGRSDKYQHISFAFNVGEGRFAFVADIEGEQIVVMDNGTEFGEGKGYENIDGPVVVGGKLAFRARKDGKWIIAVEDGRELGSEYSMVGSPQDIDNEIWFLAQKDGFQFIANEFGETVAKDLGYTHVGAPVRSGDNIVFVAKTRPGDEFIATDDEDKIHEGKEYSYKGIFDVGGKVVARVDKLLLGHGGGSGGGVQTRTFLVLEEGKQIGLSDNYNVIGVPTEIDGQIAFPAEKSGQWSITFEDGRRIELDPEYSVVFGLEQVDSTHISICARNANAFVRETIEIPRTGSAK